jgi:hypothetical protein
MNRFKETLDELRQRPAGKQLVEILSELPKGAEQPVAPSAPEGSNGSFRLPYSSDPKPIVEPWK